MQLSDVKLSSPSTITTIVLVLLLVYFGYHAITGDRGLLALMRLSKQVEQSRNDLDQVVADKLSLEHRVSLLRDESLDLDLLDEQSRKLLGYVGKDEVIYMPPKKKEKSLQGMAKP
jgi:cell division protein FtsB